MVQRFTVGRFNGWQISSKDLQRVNICPLNFEPRQGEQRGENSGARIQNKLRKTRKARKGGN